MAENAVTFESEGLENNSVQVADSSHLFQAEVTALRQNQENTSFIELSPRQGEGIWALAREAYRLTGEAEPSPTQVKALAQDIARRNNLPIDAALSSGMRLMVKMPGSIDGSVGPRADISNASASFSGELAKEPGVAAVDNSPYLRKVSTRQVDSASQVASPKSELTRKPASQDALTSNPSKGADAPKCSTSWEEVNMIATWVTKNEAGHKSYTAFNEDDNGAGISVGLMQWNQERGLLPELVEEWHDKSPAKFREVFGSNATNMLNESWLRSVDFSNSPGLTQDMKEALAVPAFQQVQLDLRNEHIEESCEMAKGYGFTSLRGRAVIADLINQLGKGGTRRFLRKVPLSGNESNRIEQLKNATDDRVNAADRIAIIEEEVRKIWRQQAVAQN